MKMLALILAVTAAGLLPSPDRVRKIEAERLAALKAQAEVARKLAVGERAPLEAALEARLPLLRAEVASARPQDATRPPIEAAEAAAGKVKGLQRERIAALKSLVDLSTRLFEKDAAPLEAAIEARELVFEAELDVAETEPERLTLLKDLVDALKGYEEQAKAMKQAARGTEAAVLKARARRLEAEIRLERAKVKTADRGRPKVVITSPTVKEVVITEQYTCRINAGRHIEVRSQEQGYLDEIPIKEGQAVKRGDLLFKLAPTLRTAKLDVELAEVKLAELELKDAETRLQGEDESISKGELERLQARRERAQARAKLAEAELGSTMIRAPFDGLVDRMGKQPGSLISERDVLTTLSDNGVMWAYFNMPEARYLEYRASRDKRAEDEQVELRLSDGTMFPHAGAIAAIEAEFDGETGTLAFRADFPNPDGLLRHGQTGTVVMHRVLKDATVIPQRATFEAFDKRYVYVVDKDDVAHRREIVVQNELEDVFVVKQGLSAGDRIVLDGVPQVRDGEKVSAEFRKPNEVLASPNRRAASGGL